MPAGQTFPNILIRHGVSFGALQSANPGVNLTALRGGQILCVPPSGTRGLCPSCNGITHTISRNETIDGIARHYRTTLANILRGNPNLAPQDFTVGRTICIPR
ncbi:MAG: LysM peptidoglycan-binding domain-containing protein [Firmicutes bacterium]|nr:LysM peptidoglycan-binding domain-containing protein [Bacillota bacterium]